MSLLIFKIYKPNITDEYSAITMFKAQIYPQNVYGLLKKIIILQYERASKTYRSTFTGK